MSNPHDAARDPRSGGPTAEAKLAADRETARKKLAADARKLREEADKLANTAAEDKAKADAAKFGKASPEQVKADESKQKADDAHAKAVEAERAAKAGPPIPPYEHGEMVEMTKDGLDSTVHHSTVESHKAAGWELKPLVEKRVPA